MYKSGMQFVHESVEDEARQLHADPQTLEIISRYQTAFDAGTEAAAAGKCSQSEGILSVCQLLGLVPNPEGFHS